MRRFIVFLAYTSEKEIPKEPPKSLLGAMTNYMAAMMCKGLIVSYSNVLTGTHDNRRLIFKSSGNPPYSKHDVPSTKELILAYWVMDVKDLAEATAWATKCPAMEGMAIDIKRISAGQDLKDEMIAEVKKVMIAQINEQIKLKKQQEAIAGKKRKMEPS